MTIWIWIPLTSNIAVSLIVSNYIRAKFWLYFIVKYIIFLHRMLLCSMSARETRARTSSCWWRARRTSHRRPSTRSWRCAAGSRWLAAGSRVPSVSPTRPGEPCRVADCLQSLQVCDFIKSSNIRTYHVFLWISTSISASIGICVISNCRIPYPK